MLVPQRRLLKTLSSISLAVALVASTVAIATSASAATCSTANVVSGSNFEIDANANLAVDGSNPCVDWLAGGSGTAMRSGVITHNDAPSGANDDSFGQGTSENDANPTIVSGSIPPNKSDLKVFGLFQETTATGKFLELFWSRVQNPSGSTNMDFELNKKFCDPSATPTNCADNGPLTPKTPVRSVGDKLITYDLDNGGIVPSISIRTWNGTKWGAATVISGAGGSALGAVNTSLIAATGTGGIGSQDAYTFGEAALNFSVLFPAGGECGTFGSAYLKSRSSTSFSAAIKDFVSPQQVTITNCASIETSATASAVLGSPIHDTATLSNATAGAGGTITFHLYSDAACANEITTGLSPVAVSGNGNYGSGDYTPTAVGTYYWIASYSGDLNNAPASGECGDTGESSVIDRAQPAIVTTATAATTVGSPIHDTATLSGATATAGGTITFHLYSDAACSTQVTTGLTPVSVSGNGNYGSGDFTPTLVGTYYWIASYSGDTNNKPVDGLCGDTGETSVVNPADSSIVTSQTITPQDSVTISATAGGTPTGTVTFKLYGPNNATCSAAGSAAVYTETVTLSGGTGSTNNTTFSVTSATASTYKWLVVYSGDTKHNGVTSGCGTEQFTLTIKNT